MGELADEQINFIVNGSRRPEPDKLEQVKEYAIAKMKEHGLLPLWRFCFDGAKRRNGQCRYRKHEIGVSEFYAEHNPIEMVQNTVLHEIAHALVGRNHGHDLVWQAKALEIGCNGNRCTDAPVKMEGKYTAKCPVCHDKTPLHKKPTRKRSCGKCSRRYDERFLVVVTDNKTAEVIPLY